MNCEQARALVDASLDDELDLMRQIQLDEHLETCASCARVYEARRALQSALRRSDLYFTAPAGLRYRVRAAAPHPAARLRGAVWPAVALAAVLILAVSTALLLRPRPPAPDVLAQEFVSSHVRSLLPGHLTDVVSSDQHTVKPWFAGRVDFSPPVPDLADHGFPLAGGRLDYVGGRTVAVLVYTRHKHVLNVFLWPSSADSAQTETEVHGYHLVRWTHAGLSYWAVSDVAAPELRQFVRLMQQ